MEETMTTMHVLDSVKNVNGGVEPTLRGFAEVLGVPATRLYAKAKQPIIGAVYDPNVVNWDALNEYFVTKLSEETCEFHTMDALVRAAAEKDEWLKEHKVTRHASADNTIEVDGIKIPKRKSAMFEMGGEQESLLCFKHDGAVYKMVYQTLSHTAIREVTATGEFAKEEVRVISNGTLNTKCVPPMSMKAAIEERFSGAYAEKTAVANKETEDEAVAEG